MLRQTTEAEKAFNNTLARTMLTVIRDAARRENVSPVSVLCCALAHLTLALKTTARAGDASEQGADVMRRLVDMYVSPQVADGQVAPGSEDVRKASAALLLRMMLKTPSGRA